jgi:hypothetical protein
MTAVRGENTPSADLLGGAYPRFFAFATNSAMKARLREGGDVDLGCPIFGLKAAGLAVALRDRPDRQ